MTFIPTAPKYWVVGGGIVGTSEIWGIVSIAIKDVCSDYCPCSPNAWMWCTIAYMKMIKARYPSPYY